MANGNFQPRLESGGIISGALHDARTYAVAGLATAASMFGGNIANAQDTAPVSPEPCLPSQPCGPIDTPGMRDYIEQCNRKAGSGIGNLGGRFKNLYKTRYEMAASFLPYSDCDTDTGGLEDIGDRTIVMSQYVKPPGRKNWVEIKTTRTDINDDFKGRMVKTMGSSACKIGLQKRSKSASSTSRPQVNTTVSVEWDVHEWAKPLGAKDSTKKLSSKSVRC